MKILIAIFRCFPYGGLQKDFLKKQGVVFSMTDNGQYSGSIFFVARFIKETKGKELEEM